ncbi:MAG: bifunctional 5,10-methylene-tetrahydrofolate dehydrogenase/5,10-methylene-tetrahydrofolate cyclohydrolase [Candidatus Diapherotrites archaeon]|nr:bifunctional 5,10-methylene-tetrahydrofolate dehydrogenase/5,10-methylene-tetrahydrofolate cyclohydrolase [Candidatus Diapherotrites archaeon]
MAAKIIDGSSIAKSIREKVAIEVAGLKKKGISPGLAVVIAGNDSASEIYVKKKQEACIQAGIYSEKHALPENVSEKELLGLIARLNADKKINGILVQLPLPAHINQNRVIQAIEPEKDVDGFTLKNIAKVFVGKEDLAAATPKGSMKLIESTGQPIEGKNAVVVGKSNHVGKPLAVMLMNRHATVTVCHRLTKNLKSFTKEADILCVAVGKPNLITRDMVKKGAIVIDIGINRLADGNVVGDASEDVKDVAGWITPVPRGVGPMTVASLLENTIIATKRQMEK